MKWAIASACCYLLTACVSATPIRLSDGSMGQTIKCPGMARTMMDCYQKAGEICSQGYDVLGGDTQAQPFAIANSNGAFSGVSVNRALMVRCR